ncbi:hypothetical protein CEY12_06330 [Chryseobacterium sp. T16E-39]|uniref:hypothetical protein n=1 Tax=Chryseobacterium sp. T16E-39 TaxID=2015076 RepID=UPI000B5B1470|nr:hypothetical protein [Chryseobacterium sp. T16E-39]ASK29745.1 hypothetical protein CEY12_06330 [Chryseobacterium sp. T16E-39]
MNIKTAKEKGFTHIGCTYNVVKIYAKDVDSYSPDITGVNWFNNILLEIATWLDINLQLNDGFYMQVTEIK